MTRRTEIIEMLEKETLSAQEIASIYGVILTDIEEDLHHIAKTVRPERELRINPAYCKQCGFIFKERSKVKKPSKCPKCKSEAIDFPKFMIVEAKH